MVILMVILTSCDISPLSQIFFSHNIFLLPIIFAKPLNHTNIMPVSGCKILQVICAIVIVIMVVATVFLLAGALGLSSSAASESDGQASSSGLAAMGVAGILIWAAINIGITAIFMKVYGDCAKRIDLLDAAGLPYKPKQLKPALDDKLTAAAVGHSVKESLDKSPIESQSADE